MRTAKFFMLLFFFSAKRGFTEDMNFKLEHLKTDHCIFALA